MPKREVFGAYVDFCSESHFESTTPASFGKFLKKVPLPSHLSPPLLSPFSPTPPFSLQADVMKPLAIEHLMDNQVQTLSGGEHAPCVYRQSASTAVTVGTPLRRRQQVPSQLCFACAVPFCFSRSLVMPACSTVVQPSPALVPPSTTCVTGELQRVAITLCLGQPANVYLIDEPSAYLDSEQRILAAKVIKR